MYIKMINFTVSQDSPLYLQLTRKIEQDIAQGYLKKGDRLPSIRKLSQSLNLSRTTIENAYEKLCDDGYIISSAKRGFYVNISTEDAIIREQIISSPRKSIHSKILYDFSSSSIDPQCFDAKLWKRYIRDILDNEQKIYTYGDPQGEIELRYALQRYAYTMRGVLCKEEQIIIGSSFQSLLYQLCGLLPKTQVIAMEAPGFSKAKQVFRDYGFSIVELPRKCDGLDLEALQKSKPTILYLHSAAVGHHKKPLSIKQRQAILSWAIQHHVLIIEDDHNGELRYLSKPMPAMQGMDTSEQVIYIGSFSKLLLPSLRIGYMVLNQKYSTQFKKYKQNYSPTSSKIEQLALAHYIIDGHLEKQIRRSKKRYEYRSRSLLQICQSIFPEWISYIEEASLRIHMQAPFPYDFNNLVKQAYEKQILLQVNETGDILLSFTSVQIEDFDYVLNIIRDLWISII